KGECAKDGKHGRTSAHNPELKVGVEMLREGCERNDRDGRIDIAHSAPQEIGRGRFAPSRQRMKSNEERNVALKSFRERNVNGAARILLEQGVPCRRHDADDL